MQYEYMTDKPEDIEISGPVSKDHWCYGCRYVAVLPKNPHGQYFHCHNMQLTKFFDGVNIPGVNVPLVIRCRILDQREMLQPYKVSDR